MNKLMGTFMLFFSIFSTNTYAISGHSLCYYDDYADCCDEVPLGWCLDSHSMIFKILTVPQWKNFKSKGEFYGSPHDIRDGFIHLATGKQLGSVLEKYFNDVPVYIAGYDPIDFKQDLKWENGYPHLYGGPLILDKTKGPRYYFDTN
jgi:uncharacterized protein (DUF952 family)